MSDDLPYVPKLVNGLTIEAIDYDPVPLEEGEADPFLFHVTSRPNAELIFKEGLQPNAAATAGRGGGYESHSRGRVFFTDAAGVPFWKHRVEMHLFDQFDDPPEVVVLMIERAPLEEHLEIDELGSRDSRTTSYYVSGEALAQIAEEAKYESDVYRGINPKLRPVSVEDITFKHSESVHSVVEAVTSGGEVVGSAAYRHHDGHIQIIGSVTVRPDMRRKGIATALLNQIADANPGLKIDPDEFLSEAGQRFWEGWDRSRPGVAIERHDKAPEYEVRIDHTAAHSGQNDFAARAVGSEGQYFGGALYSVYQGEIFVNFVEVNPAYRRLGIATRLYERILAEHPNATLANSGVTPTGSAFRKAFDASHADRLTPALPDRPEPFSDQEWEQVSAAYKEAIARSGRDSEEAEAIFDAMNAMNDYDSAVSALPLDLRGVELPVKPDLPPTGQGRLENRPRLSR